MAHASKTNEQLIVLNGHHSHKTLEAINFCLNNWIHLITLPLVAPIQLPNVMSTTTAAAKLKAVVTKETPQSIDAVLPVVDEYLGLKSAPKTLEKISLCPKIPILRQQKRKTESAENLTSSPFKKR